MTQMRMVDLEQQATAVVGEQVTKDGLSDFFDHAFATVMAVTGRQGLPVTGPPFALYRGLPAETIDVEAGFPTASVVEAEADVRPGVIPACRAVEALHVGSYDTLSQTYDDVLRWAGEQGLRQAGPMWEQYLTDPSVDSDPATWRTRVLVPVA